MAPNFTPKEDAVYLIDGSGYIFRAYFAIHNLKTKSGIPTNAVFGFTNMLLKLFKTHKPKYIAIAFDAKDKTFRSDIFVGYKANRPPAPADLIPQFELIHKVVDAFGIKKFVIPKVEADDVIGTLQKIARKENKQVVIVTGDKDFMQLVDDNTFILDELRALKNGAEIFIDVAEVNNYFLVPPKNVVDILALSGDKSDNIPGVKGVGVKTAANLVNELGSLENIYAHLDKISSKSLLNKLTIDKENAFISKELATIKTDVDLNVKNIESIEFKGFETEALKEIFAYLEFKKLLLDKDLFGSDASVTEEQAKEKISVIVDDIRNISSYTKNLSANTFVAFDLFLLPEKKFLLLLAFENSCFVFNGSEENKTLIEELSKFNLISFFSKENYSALLAIGVQNICLQEDISLALYLLGVPDNDKDRIKYLADIAHVNVDFELAVEDSQQYDKAYMNMLALRAVEKVTDLLKDSSSLDVYKNIELPLTKVLAKMERYGVLIDVNKLKNLEKILAENLSKLNEKAYELAGQEFNLLSPKQVAHILYEKLKLKPSKKNKLGFSTSANVLEELSMSHELPLVILQVRETAKLLNTYVKVLPALINENTGRVHTTFNQRIAQTGRLSSKDPNLQNIPVRTKEGGEIRKAFIAKEGYSLISLDYSQVEIRILSFMSDDKILQDAFNKGQDVHERTAIEIFGVTDRAVTKEERNIAKTINFGLLYGMGPFRLASTLKISLSDAKKYWSLYQEKYANIFTFKDTLIKKAKETGYAETLFGRKRNIEDINSKNALIRARAERLAVNTPIQGTAADIIKIAMIKTDEFLTKEYEDAHMILQIHDEIVIEAPTEYCDQIAKKVSQIMAKGHGLSLDLKVDFNFSSNWGDAH